MLPRAGWAVDYDALDDHASAAAVIPAAAPAAHDLLPRRLVPPPTAHDRRRRHRGGRGRARGRLPPLPGPRSSTTARSSRSSRQRRACWPWTTCPDAAGPLHAVEGMKLSPRCLAVGKVADPKQQCTHMFDLAGLAVAYVARGCGPVGTTRQYDIEIPAEVRRGEPAAVTCARDGELLHEWRMDTWRLVAPEPFASVPWRGGFFRWADETLDVDGAEAAIVLRRVCDIGLGRGMDLDAVDRADEMRDQMAGCASRCSPRRSPSPCATRPRSSTSTPTQTPCCTTTYAMRSLAACLLGGAGHLQPLLPFLRAAREQGHETLVVGPRPWHRWSRRPDTG